MNARTVSSFRCRNYKHMKKDFKGCGIKVSVREKVTLRVAAAEGVDGCRISIPNSGSVLGRSISLHLFRPFSFDIHTPSDFLLFFFFFFSRQDLALTSSRVKGLSSDLRAAPAPRFRIVLQPFAEFRTKCEQGMPPLAPLPFFTPSSRPLVHRPP